MSFEKHLEMILDLNARAFKQGIKASIGAVRGLGPAVARSVKKGNKAFKTGVVAAKAYRDELRRVESQTSGMGSSIGGLVGAVGGGLALATAGRMAVGFNSTIEQSQIGIAALVRTFNELPDSTDAYSDSMNIAADIQRNLQIEGLKTVATYEQLLVALQEGIGPAFKQGFDPKQVVEFTSLMTQTAAGISLPMNQLGQEIRSILDGTIDRNSRVAKALGITNEKVKEMASQGKLFDYLRGKLEEFGKAGEDAAKTWTGAWSNLIDAVQMGLGKGSEDSYSAFKQLFLNLRDIIVEIDEEAGTFAFNEKILAAIDKADAAISGFIESFTKDDLEKYLVIIAETVSAVVEVVVLFFKAMKGLIDIMGPALPTIARWTAAFVLFGGALKVLIGLPLLLVKQLLALNAAFAAVSGGSILLYLKHVQQASQHTGLFKTAIASVPNALVTAGGLMAAAFVGWQIGTWLYNQSDIVKKAGNRIAAAFTYIGLKAKQGWAWVTGGDTAAVQREIDAAKDIYREMYNDIGKGAKKAGEAHKSVAVSGKKSAEMQAKAQKGATEEMKKAYKSYADTVKKLQDDIAGREQSLAEQLREMDRSGMSDLKAWKDRKNEAEEFAETARKAEEAAKAAFEAGDVETGKAKYKEAVTYFDKAKDAAAELNTEIRAGDKVIQSQQQSLKKAKPLVEEYGQAGIDIQNEFREAIQKTARALNEQSGGKLAAELPEIAKAFGDLDIQAASLVEKSAWFNDKWNEAWDEFLEEGGHAIWELDTKLSQLTKDRNIKVYVTEVTKKALGGLIGTYQRLASGGSVDFRNMLSGGFMPGFGGGDRRAILGEDGEYMLNKFSVREAGLAAAAYFNNRNWPALMRELADRFGVSARPVIRRATGGAINAIQVLPSFQPLQAGGEVSSTAFGDTYNLNMTFSGNVSQLSRQNAREISRMVLAEFQKMHRGSS